MPLFGDLFDAAGEFAQAAGSHAEAIAYRKAEKYAKQNAIISQEAGDIRLQQTQRQIYKTLGAQGAGYASAGLTGGGSAQSVLRSSISEGALAKAIVNEQTAINVTGYKSQAAQFQGMAFAADAAAVAHAASGIGDIFDAFGLSDRRLKKDIEQVGTHGNLGIYRFRFIGDDEWHVGPMADEVAIHAPYALGPVVGGYMTVDYAKLGLGHLLRIYASEGGVAPSLTS